MAASLLIVANGGLRGELGTRTNGGGIDCCCARSLGGLPIGRLIGCPFRIGAVVVEVADCDDLVLTMAAEEPALGARPTATSFDELVSD